MRTIIRNNYEPKNSDYHEKIVIDEAQDKKWIFDCDGVFTDFTDGADVSEEIKRLDNAIKTEGEERKTEDEKIWTEIDNIEMASDVVDIVGTYAELQQYDTSKLHDNDIIKVLADETHNGQTSYYRFGKTLGTFSYVGSEGPYYTENQIDTLLSGKQDTLTAGDNITITNNVISGAYTAFTGASSVAGSAGLVPAPAVGDDTKFLSGNGLWTTVSQYSLPIASVNDLGGIKVGTNLSIDANTGVLSATDTTYSDFTGTDGTLAGTHGLVPAPATTDAGKFLKADGTWDTAGGGGGDTVYSTVTTSNSATGGAVYIGDKDTNQNIISDPSSTDNKYKYFWALPASTNGSTYGKPAENSVNIMGSSNGANTVSIGYGAGMESYGAPSSVRIGSDANAGSNGVAVGFSSGSNQDHYYCVNIGSWSSIINSGVNYAVGLGAFSIPTRTGEVNVGLSAGHENGFNGSIYRVIGGVYDGQTDHDAATVGQLNGRVLQNAGTPTTATVGTVGQLLEDTTNGKLYICTDATNPYVWEEVGGASIATINSGDWSALWQ